VRRTPLISLLVLLAPVTAAQQRTAPPLLTGTSAIRGQAIDAITKQGVPGCTISVVTGPEFRSASVETGADGAYEFASIRAGNYSVAARCAAHLTSCQVTADDAPNRCSQVIVGAGQQRSDVDFMLTPGATARGRVLGADGTPIARARVRFGAALRERSGGSMMGTMTDANGAFEIRNLPAGSRRLEVELPRSRDGLRSPLVYYPGALTRDQAVAVELTAGTVTGDLTIVVPNTAGNTLTVRLRPGDRTITRTAVSVLRAAPLAVRSLELDREGVATIGGMVPGRYVVAARGSSKRRQFAAFEVIDFVGDPADISLRLLPTGSIAGKVVAEGSGRPPLSGVTVGAAWVYDGADVSPLIPNRAPVASNGAFRIDGLFGTRQLRLTGLDPRWVIRAIRQRRRDVASGVDIAPGKTTEVTIVVAPQ
jgi:hypothetical protein